MILSSLNILRSERFAIFTTDLYGAQIHFQTLILKALNAAQKACSHKTHQSQRVFSTLWSESFRKNVQDP